MANGRHNSLASREKARLPVMLAACVFALFFFGCRAPISPDQPQQRQPAAGSASTGLSNIAADQDLFDPGLHPGATVIHPLDPGKLTESQLKFGVAPRRDPSVEYQPDIILMENGDKAIKSVASDGLTWTFDANAPQVSDFQEDKIVFATGRAVGRVLSLSRQGNEVKVILGPVQLTDVIRNGHFEMNEAIDLNHMISYVAPDFPQAADPDALKTSSLRQASPRHLEERVVLSRRSSNGKWAPASMLKTFADGRRESYLHTGRHWSSSRVRTQTSRPRLLTAQLRGNGHAFGNAKLVRTELQLGPMPGVPGVQGIQPMQIPLEPFDAPKLLGQLPLVNLGGGQTIPICGSDSSVGVEYDYNKDGLKLRASGTMTMQNSGIAFFLDITNGLQAAGLRLKGNVGVKLHLNASAAQDFQANFHKKLFLPIDLSLPLGGPVPLSLTFNSSFIIDTAFSAKTSVLNAEGSYALGAGLDAGYWAKSWRLTTSGKVDTNTDMGKSVEGISVGINSIVLGFDVRTMVGIGALGFNSGVYVAFRFSGTALKGTSIGFPCRQGTINIVLDTGVGYSIPKWVTGAINIFLTPFTSKRVDPSGTFLRGPSRPIYDHLTQFPEGCASAKT